MSIVLNESFSFRRKLAYVNDKFTCHDKVNAVEKMNQILTEPQSIHDHLVGELIRNKKVSAMLPTSENPRYLLEILDSQKWLSSSMHFVSCIDRMGEDLEETIPHDDRVQGLVGDFISGMAHGFGARVFGSLSSKLVSSVGPIKSLMEKLDKALDKVISAFEWIAQTVDGCAKFLLALKEKVWGIFEDALSKIKDLISHFSYMLPLVCSIFLTSCIFFLLNKFLGLVAPQYTMSCFRLFEIIAMVGAVVGIKEISGVLLSMKKVDKMNFVNTIRNFFGCEPEVAGMINDEVRSLPSDGSEFVDVTQDLLQGGMDVGIFGAIVATLSFFLGREDRDMFFKFSYSTSIIKNTIDSYEKCTKCVGYLVDWLYQKLGQNPANYAGATQSLLIHTGICIEEWLSRCEKLMVEGNTTAMLMADVMKEARDLISQTEKIQNFLITTEEGTPFVLRSKFIQVELRLREFYKKLIQGNLSNTFRQTPFVIVFYGEPGVGKSTVARNFATNFLDAMEEPLTDRIYTRNSGDSYWSNYVRQPLVLYDDFAQIQQENGSHDEATLISLVSCNPYMLPMAAVEEKGRPFDSKYMILCTNRKSRNPSVELADPGAFNRRRHCFWEVTRNRRIQFDPDRPQRNLLFSLKVSEDADAFVSPETTNLSYEEMLLHTIQQCNEFIEKERKSLESIGRTAREIQFVRDAQGRVQGVARQDRVQADNFNFLQLFSVERARRQGGDIPNFERLVDEQGLSNLECYGSGRFFDVGGNAISYLNWTQQEKMFADTIEGAKTLPDLQAALIVSLMLDNQTSTHHADFQNQVDMKKLSTTEEVVAHRAHIQQAAEEHWASLSDRSRFLTTEIYKIKHKLPAIQTIQEIRDTIRKMDCRMIWNSIPFKYQWLIGILAFFVGGCAIYKALKSISSFLSIGPSLYISTLLGFTDSMNGGSRATGSSSSDTRVERPTRQERRGYRLQGGESEMLPHQGAVDKVMRSRICIEGANANQKSSAIFRSAYGFMIGKRKICLPSHLLLAIDWNKSCMIRTGDDKASHFVIKPELIQYQEVCQASNKVKLGNLAILTYPNYVPAFEHFDAVTYDFDAIGDQNVKGYIIPNMNTMVADYIKVTVFSKSQAKDEIFDPETKMTWKQEKLFHSPDSGIDGMCGRLALVESKGAMTICGMHCFGRTGSSKFCSIPSEFQEKDKIQGTSFYMNEVPIEQITPMVTKVGQVQHRIPKLSKTALSKSIINEEISKINGACKLEPTILSKTDARSPYPYCPYEEGIKKFVTQAGPFDNQIDDGHMQRAIQEVESEWEDARPDSFAIDTVTDLQTAINGIDGIEYAEALPIGTSEGFPYILDRPPGSIGKERFFEEVNGKRYPVGDWPEDVDEIIEGAYNGDLNIHSLACAKDEKTKISKVREQPKTRIFEILPFTFNIAIRKYYMFWMQWMMSNHNRLPCKVGINPFSYSWDDMATKHKAFANHFCGDYSGFDTNTNVDIILQVADMVSNFARDGEKNKRIRRGLMKAAVCRHVIVGQDMYFVEGGTPSGFALTVMVNSVINELYLKMSWYYLTSKHNPALRRDADLRYHTHISVYGDDNVVSFSNHVSEWFNLVTISDYLKTKNIILTDGRKTNVLLERMNFEDIDFLKRRWTPGHFGWNHCPLDKISIESQVYFVRKNDDPVEALRVNIDNSMREAYHHGMTYFSEWRAKLVKALSNSGYHMIVPPSYRDCDLFWIEQRRGENLPTHYTDPLHRVRFLASGRPFECNNVIFTTIHDEKKKSRLGELKEGAHFFYVQNTAKQVVKETKRFHQVVVPATLSKTEMATECLIFYLTLEKLDPGIFCRALEGKGSRIVICTDSNIELAHGIGTALFSKIDPIFARVARRVSGLTDRAYHSFIQINTELNRIWPPESKIEELPISFSVNNVGLITDLELSHSQKMIMRAMGTEVV
ncbi:TPA_asm: polyprotein [Gymnema sylvestre virus 1]|uniref:RNA1 polyprotein n=1 Tax=Gymnema sylvestre virus 1 TaxID=2998508 RepID=A0AA48P8U9_9SECO|nr:TPA_asm: polyprotein [Gymnema sylvestre virus 1]